MQFLYQINKTEVRSTKAAVQKGVRQVICGFFSEGVQVIYLNGIGVVTVCLVGNGCWLLVQLLQFLPEFIIFFFKGILCFDDFRNHLRYGAIYIFTRFIAMAR